VTVVTHDGMVRSGLEVYQPYGLATNAVAAGSVVQLVAMGADPGDLVALPPVTPGLRYGNLAAGEVVLYDGTGDRVALRTGGVVQILAATQIVLTVGGVSLTVSAAGVAVTGGNVTVAGTIAATGDATAGSISLENHTHPVPDGESGAPTG
jgi:phage gp45-like